MSSTRTFIFICHKYQFCFPGYSNSNFKLWLLLQNKETNTVIQTIVDVQPRSGGGGGGDTPDQIVWRICDQSRSTIPKHIDASQINPDLMELDSMGQLHSLTTVLLHETDRFNKLLSVIHSSLNELQKAIKVEHSISIIVIYTYNNKYLFRKVLNIFSPILI